MILAGQVSSWSPVISLALHAHPRSAGPMGSLQRPSQSHVALGPMSLFIFRGGNGWQSRSPAMPLCDRDQWWSVHILDDGHGRAALVAGDKVKSSAFCESAKYQNTARGRRMLQVTRSICLLIGWGLGGLRPRQGRVHRRSGSCSLYAHVPA